MVTEAEFEYALEQVSEAWSRYKRVKSRVSNQEKDNLESDLGDFSVLVNLPNIISDCQMCIETSTKAMFKLVEVQHPQTHKISFEDDRTVGFMKSIPDDFEHSDSISRVVFLTQFWYEFYTMAKYGVPDQNIRARDIFRDSDAERAMADADFCIEIARDLLWYVEKDEGFDIFDKGTLQPKR